MSRVVIIGNAGLDLPLAVPRLPLPGETLIGRPGMRAPGGKGLNQAIVAARCGGEVRFCAPLGNDDADAAFLEACLAREGFARLILPRLGHPTDFSLLMVLPGGENSIVSTSACSLALTLEQAEPVDAIDTTGCGDAFCGVMAALLARDWAIDNTIPPAQKAAALTAMRPGTFAALPSRAELHALLAS